MDETIRKIQARAEEILRGPCTAEEHERARRLARDAWVWLTFPGTDRYPVTREEAARSLQGRALAELEAPAWR